MLKLRTSFKCHSSFLPAKSNRGFSLFHKDIVSTLLFSRSPLNHSKDENPCVSSPPNLSFGWSWMRVRLSHHVCITKSKQVSNQRVWIKSRTLAMCKCGGKLLVSVLWYSPFWCERGHGIFLLFLSFFLTFFSSFFFNSIPCLFSSLFCMIDNGGIGTLA